LASQARWCIDDRMRPVAELATDVPTLDNGGAIMVGDGAEQHLETSFHLRRNATCSDGTPVTPGDVVFSWKLSLNRFWPAPAATIWSRNIRTSWPSTRIRSSSKMKPGVLHPFYLYGLPDVWIYPSNRLGSLVDFDPQNSAKVADLQSSVYGRRPVGSGPYTLESWDPGIQMVLRARSDYFRGKPASDTIIIRGFGASKGTLLSRLQAGDLQTLGSDTLDASDVDAINGIPGVTAYVSAGTTVEHIDFNLQSPILAGK
jgi:ABC-type transport system substrate-binding protein